MNFLDRLYEWLEWDTPFRCHCGHWVMRKRDAKSLRVTWGEYALFCPACHAKERRWDKS